MNRDERGDADRVRAVHQLGLLDTPDEERFDRITRLAARLLGTEVALVNLVDADRQFTKSRRGIDLLSIPRSESVCTNVVAQDDVLVVRDLSLDARFAQLPVVAQDGMRFYAGAPLHDLDGQPVGALCVLSRTPRELDDEQRDVLVALAGWAQAELNAGTAARAAEAAHLSESRMRALLDGAPGAVLLLDEDTVVQWANAQAASMFGRVDQQLPGSTLRELVPDLDLDDLRGRDRRQSEVLAASGRRLLQAGRRGDGTAFTVELFVSRLLGSPQRYAVFARDLDAERDERRELTQLRERTEVIFDALAEGVVVVEADGVVAFANFAAAHLLERRRSDLVGRRWHDLVHARCAQPSCDLDALLLHVGQRLSPVELHREGAPALPVELSVRLAGGGAGGPALVVTLVDLSERLAVDRMKTDFVSSVSHELRTPLTSIRGSLGLLVAGAVEPASEQGRRMLEIAAASSERLVRLVNDILDLERLRSHGVELELGVHRVVALMHAAVQSVSGAATQAGVRIDVADTDACVLADADRAVQILVNLLGNAIKFSPEGQTVGLWAERVDGVVRISVRDHGRGIPPEQLERIFERFSQVDASDRRAQSGTGLGLAIARTLAEQHGGRLTAQSVEGRGSTFVLELAADGRAARRLAYAPASTVPADVSRVLREHYEVVPMDALELSRVRGHARPASVLLAEGPADEVAAVRQAAAAADVPLLALATLTREGVPSTAPPAALLARREGHRAVVLLVEDDADLAEVLSTGLRRHDLDVVVAADQLSAVASATSRRPDLLVLDLCLARGDGYGVVEELRRHEDLRTTPVVVYSVSEPGADDRARLQLGATQFLTKTKQGADDVEALVLRLLAGLAGTQDERATPAGEGVP
jgi:PAS domain S-box-containing protein